MTMPTKRIFTPDQLRYLQLLSKEYPTVQAASAEIIRLQSILNLPKAPSISCPISMASTTPFCTF